MSNLTPYLERNQAFAASGAQADVPPIPFIPFKQLYLIICIDPRVEPAAVLGVRPLCDQFFAAGAQRLPALGSFRSMR